MENDDFEKEFRIFKKREMAQQTFLLFLQQGLVLITVGIASLGLIRFMKTHNYEKIIISIIRITGDLFTLTGFFVIFFALIEYRRKTRNNTEQYVPLFDLPLAMGIMVCLIGVLALSTIVIEIIY